ncbi:MAG: AsmA family protein [Pseudomonadota bacterium]
MKWISRLLGVLVLIIVVMIGGLFLIPADRIAQIAADQIRTVTGRDVSISGDVSLSLWPVIGASVGGLEVGNAEWSEQGPMLTADNAAIGIDATALLRGEIRITNIEATSPTIRLDQRRDGRASWQFTDGSGAAQIETQVDPDAPQRAFSIERLSVTNATLIYDAEGADLVQYSGVDLHLDWPERLGPAEINATLRPAGSAVEVQATIGAFAGFIGGQVQPVDVVIRAAGGRVALDGRASTAGAVAGALDLNLPDTGGFLAALGLPRPDLPRGLGRNVVATGDLTLTEGRALSLRGLTADLGGNRLTGAADVSLNGTPQVNASFEAGALDLTGLTGGSSGGSSGASGGSEAGWSRDAIDASGLAAFNGEIGLRAASIDLGAFKLGATRALLTNDRSRMVFELREVQAYDGVVTGQFVVNNRNGLSVGGNMIANGIGMQPLLTDAIGIDRLTGAGDAEIQFLGVGNSVHAIMNSLSGKGAVQIGRGTIEGIDLDRLMRSGDVGSGTTVFDSLGMTFAMEGGNLTNDNLLLKLASYEARGKGRVGLGAQDIDYAFTPIALNANQGTGIAIPVRIRGPWSGPRIIPDLEAPIDLNLAAEKEALKDRAEQAVKDKVAEELGVTATDGKSLEEAAKDKLENEVRDGLRRLFD